MRSGERVSISGKSGGIAEESARVVMVVVVSLFFVSVLSVFEKFNEKEMRATIQPSFTNIDCYNQCD